MPWDEPAAALDGRDVGALAAAVRRAVDQAGVTFGAKGDERFHLDPVPRVIAVSEWAALEAGLAQRVRALDRFCADVYGARRIVREGVVPARVATLALLEPEAAPRPLGDVASLLAGTLAAAGSGDAIVLTDGPANSAYW